MIVVTKHLRHGGKSLDATLNYLAFRKESYPALSKAFDLYARIFSIQRRYLETIKLPSQTSVANAEAPGPMGPLPVIDAKEVVCILSEICEALGEAAPERSAGLTEILQLWRNGEIGTGPDAASAFRGDAPVREMALLALNPFYEKFALEVIPRIEDNKWNQPSCPICGQHPFIGLYDISSGERYLQCELCRTQWERERLTCGFCGCHDSDMLGYISVSSGNAHRVETCDLCKRYMKIVDERSLGREAVPHVEEITMIDLEAEAKSNGYRPYCSSG